MTTKVCDYCRVAIEDDYIVDGEPIECEYTVRHNNVTYLNVDLIARTVGDELLAHSCYSAATDPCACLC